MALPSFQKSETDPGWNRGVCKFQDKEQSREFSRNPPKTKKPRFQIGNGVL